MPDRPLPTLGLCLIVKDEERYLEACVDSVQAVCDQVVIVDTGSTDHTVAIARTLADDVAEITFDGNFSAARNVAFDRCRTDWVVFLDADERFEADQAAALPGLVACLPDDVLGATVQRFNLFSTGDFYSGRQLKVLRGHPDVRYERRVNESAKGSITRLGGRIVQAQIFLNHFGHCRSVEERDAKAHRYLELMHRQLAERPGDAVLTGYVGLILRTLGRFDEAGDWARRAVDLDPSHPVVQQFAGHVHRSQGDLASARIAFARATELDPDDAGAWNMLGVVLLSTDPDAAEVPFRRALELEPLTLGAELNLGLLRQQQRRWPEAIEHFERLAAANPAFLHEEWAGRVEIDPFRMFYNETIFRYAGLGYHLAYCRERAASATVERPLGAGAA
ncbi:MAG: hypothetical protein JWM47_833 [Acidimicrobiales bacterium]|nr:hypothetical protein [Acidimicrobiales bacterium]